MLFGDTSTVTIKANQYGGYLIFAVLGIWNILSGNKKQSYRIFEGGNHDK